METAPKTLKVVYTIVERSRDGRKFWLRVGSAFNNHDGSINVYLDAMPTNGQLQIRDYKPLADRTGNKNGAERVAQAIASQRPSEALAS